MPNIEIADLKPGYLYRLNARNIRIGVWNPATHGGRGSFIGIRTKFNSRFLDTELHYDADPNFGTATPTEELADCPIQNINHDLGLVCRKCDLPMEHVGAPGSIRHVHIIPTDCADDWGWLKNNALLFDWLEEKEKELSSAER
jgi:hypothetical protein